MTRVLVSAPYMQAALDRFRRHFDAVGVEVIAPPVRERMTEEELAPFAGAIDGAICGDDAFSAAVLQAASPRLRVLSKWGTGVDSIDRKEAARLGIQVFNTPGAFTDAVADSVIGLMLAFARRIPWTDRTIKEGVWEKPPCRALAECSLGVVGVGAIGKAVLRRARAFGMELLGNDIVSIDPAFRAETGVSMLPLGPLLERADFISVNCDLNPSSLGLIDAQALARVKPSAVLINTARGPIVVEAALVAALQQGRLAGAGLDVFEQEPLPGDSPLRTMDNVLLSAHNANSSPRAWERVHRNTIDNLFRGLGLPVPTWPEGPTSGEGSEG
ncbi:MAG TPA: phosphoglycerate dehydrogenase [Anaerolineales bacterium]|nr:phosphoglycerate dehydrogenase [Anaerolineales bacterium]